MVERLEFLFGKGGFSETMRSVQAMTQIFLDKEKLQGKSPGAKPKTSAKKVDGKGRFFNGRAGAGWLASVVVTASALAYDKDFVKSRHLSVNRKNVEAFERRKRQFLIPD